MSHPPSSSSSSPSRSPAPAPAALASTLLATAERSRQTRPTFLATGCTALDGAALDGGFRYGEVSCLAGEGAVGRIISLHALTTHLLQNSAAEVALIDTTGSFSPVRLRDVIVSRLRGGGHPARGPEYVEKGYMYSRIEGKVGGREKEDLDVDGMEGKVQGVLERVMVMRVFDFVGVVEAVVEVGGRLESRRGQGLLRVSDEEEGDGAVSGVGRERAGREEEVADSEDEDFMEELRAGKTDGKVELNAGGGLGDERATGRVGMVVIDSIANVVSSMMTKNQVQGHALLTTFMRSLHHLTHTHHLCTLLINSIVGLHPSDHPSYRRRPDESSNLSIFESTAGKPALGKTFAYLVDTSLLLSKVPKGDEALVDRQNVEVLEVVKDRYGAREGRWAAFHIADGVELQNAF